MNKICTSIEQSKKLMELGIDVNTADMYWWYGGKVYYVEAMEDGDFNKESDIPCWSLAALLEVIPNVVVENFDDTTYVVSAHKKIDGVGYAYLGGADADNSVDACVELIEKLHKDGLL